MNRTFLKAAVLAASLFYLDAFILGSAAAQVNRVPQLPTVDSTGAANVNQEGQKASYFAGLGANSPAATPTDIAILTGSATKTIKVTKVVISVGATSSGAVQFDLVKRSGGTQSAVNTAFAAGTHGGLMDSTDIASTVITAGLAGVYTSNAASLGTIAGIVRSWTTTILANAGREFIYECTVPDKCITLRGVTQVLAINGAGHTLLTAEKVGVAFEWTEE